ncbi:MULTISPECIES: oligosaccharide flippase family protein [unclassified Nostoc]|uniref:oligosaccharide flippase family protein n=1 Tax=unclassified Nostoc TaxID=2593658 RepID=UPI002AD2EA65|nr:oligosaccharide flippase family protein [Nostoc sp. DedQUE03]MDZ7973995.1 oligosaccharide flippase family protein [Nostoc sp. DedQUE03]MDZ8045777.1 oligosaccharide flippase family protein [Nostoc sp. DedQUE02]
MGQRKLLTNSFSLLINRLVQSITSFVLVASIARTLGAYELGRYLLAFSYYYIFMAIGSQGLKTLLTRELSRNPQEMPIYLVNGTFLQIVLSIIAYVAQIIVVFVLPYNSDTSTTCYIMGLTIIPFSLSNITEAVFQAQERMNMISISTVPVYVLRLVVMLWFLHLNYGVNHLAGVLAISETIVFVIEWILLTRVVKPKWQIKQDFILQLLKSARTFMLIDAVGIISSRMGILIISLLGSELMVGLYGVIGQLMLPMTIACDSICMAAFPVMTKAVSLGRQQLRQITENVIEMLLCLSLPLLVVILFVGNDLITLIYKDPNFNQVNLVLKVSSLTLITYPFSRTLVYLLLANGFEKFNLGQVIVTNAVGLISGVVFISQYKLMGAAFMQLSMSITGFTLLIYAVYSKLFPLRLLRIMRRPMLISACMGLVLLILQRFRLEFIFILLISTCIYSLLASCLIINKFGGVRAVWGKLFSMNSEKI